MRHPRSAPPATVPCVFCARAIPSGSFAYWSLGTLLVTAACPSCLGHMTMATEAWRLRQPVVVPREPLPVRVVVSPS